jgi:hypothetical protein
MHVHGRHEGQRAEHRGNKTEEQRTVIMTIPTILTVRYVRSSRPRIRPTRRDLHCGLSRALHKNITKLIVPLQGSERGHPLVLLTVRVWLSLL